MKKISTVAALILLCLLTMNVYAEQKDNVKCQDHPMFTRMPGYWIHGCDHKQFDGVDFKIAEKGKVTQTIRVEGELWMVRYYPQADMKSKPSELQIFRNFENAIRKQGGTLIGTTDKKRQVFKLSKDGNEIWVEVWADFTGKHGYTIIQRKEMAQDVVADAQAFSNDLRTTGHAAVYGIYFDTGKSSIKPESARAISEIAKLLKSDPSLKIHVVGHTDNVGGVESNIKLSQSRAEAVVQELVKNNGIAASRLRAHGCGQFAPVASNDTEEGRGKNRRVELVKQ
ncbi:MAG: OmpA family protein [Deltaproteobacteria bacterium]|nr:OmpA family protein [Deltaproteobacteria bacterium]